MPEKSKNIAQNKKARHDYAILDTLEAGIALTGTEVKSCRAGGVSLVDSYATIREGNLILLGTHIAPYAFGNRENHEERRNRRLLVHKKEILRLKKNIEQKGLTLIPLSFYFNSHGRVKVSIGICRGKNAGDKRETLKEREDKRDMDRMRKR
ncbi:MAG: SsrA-binding protein SmpB [Lentisphaeria bacterium]|nr:SsrA-binding protein SmpB [Lentisphaeria bacterium]